LPAIWDVPDATSVAGSQDFAIGWAADSTARAGAVAGY
jgi:hypothetical protein